MTVYVPPGQPGSVVSYEPRYDNWIGGERVAPVRGQYFENVTPVTGQPFTEIARSTAGWRAVGHVGASLVKRLSAITRSAYASSASLSASSRSAAS